MPTFGPNDPRSAEIRSRGMSPEQIYTEWSARPKTWQKPYDQANTPRIYSTDPTIPYPTFLPTHLNTATAQGQPQAVQQPIQQPFMPQIDLPPAAPAGQAPVAGQPDPTTVAGQFRIGGSKPRKKPSLMDIA